MTFSGCSINPSLLLYGVPSFYLKCFPQHSTSQVWSSQNTCSLVSCCVLKLLFGATFLEQLFSFACVVWIILFLSHLVVHLLLPIELYSIKRRFRSSLLPFSTLSLFQSVSLASTAISMKMTLNNGIHTHHMSFLHPPCLLPFLHPHPL